MWVKQTAAIPEAYAAGQTGGAIDGESFSGVGERRAQVDNARKAVDRYVNRGGSERVGLACGAHALPCPKMT